MMTAAAEQLVREWADGFFRLNGAYEKALVGDVLTQLADPSSDYDELLEEICQRRWFVGRCAS